MFGIAPSFVFKDKDAPLGGQVALSFSLEPEVREGEVVATSRWLKRPVDSPFLL